MALPDPRPGLVISYAYLWHRERQAGREEGIKDRPCVVVLSIEAALDGTKLVRVAPITHTEPTNPQHAVELPPKVKQHLGLDDRRSWIIADEINEFAWPGFDLRPVAPGAGYFAYGFIPPRLLVDVVETMRKVWHAGLGRRTPRD
jgi:mRNA-degrading endonuclease toxin of MazEF toxin-antitoxin module